MVRRWCQKQPRLQRLAVGAKTFPDRSQRALPIGVGRWCVLLIHLALIKELWRWLKEVGDKLLEQTSFLSPSHIFFMCSNRSPLPINHHRRVIWTPCDTNGLTTFKGGSVRNMFLHKCYSFLVLTRLNLHFYNSNFRHKARTSELCLTVKRSEKRVGLTVASEQQPCGVQVVERVCLVDGSFDYSMWFYYW